MYLAATIQIRGCLAETRRSFLCPVRSPSRSLSRSLYARLLQLSRVYICTCARQFDASSSNSVVWSVVRSSIRELPRAIKCKLDFTRVHSVLYIPRINIPRNEEPDKIIKSRRIRNIHINIEDQLGDHDRF